MPDDDSDHDTEQAPTEQASAETTELPPASHAAATPEAWSLDDDAEVDLAQHGSRLVSAGLVALVLVVTGALIYFAATLFGAGPSKHVERPAIPSPTTTVRLSAPAVTVTAAPPAAPAPPTSP